MTELRRPEPLDPRLRDRSTFDSGASDLDEWLRRYSTQNRQRNTAATWVTTAADSAVAHVLATAVDLNARAACRAVVVNAIDQAARSWWERLGFHPFDPADPGNPDLYLLTSEIEATLRPHDRADV